jgi:hypothetical protein
MSQDVRDFLTRLCAILREAVEEAGGMILPIAAQLQKCNTGSFGVPSLLVIIAQPFCASAPSSNIEIRHGALDGIPPKRAYRTTR